MTSGTCLKNFVIVFLFLSVFLAPSYHNHLDIPLWHLLEWEHHDNGVRDALPLGHESSSHHLHLKKDYGRPSQGDDLNPKISLVLSQIIKGYSSISKNQRSRSQAIPRDRKPEDYFSHRVSGLSPPVC